MKSSHSFRTTQTLLSIWETADSLLGSSLRAPRGHTAMQLMQEMHALPAARLGPPLSIAQTGHAAAHAPQETQSSVASGAMPNRSATTAGILPAYAGTEITATSSSVIETALKSSPLSVRSTVAVFLSSAPATRPDTFRVPPVGLNTISNTLIEAPSPYARQHVKPFSHSDRVYGAWDSRFGAPSTPMHPPYAVCLFVLYKLRYRLHIFTGYRRVLLRYPILAVQKPEYSAT